MPPSTQPRTIVIVAYAGVQSLDVTGPLEVFTAPHSASSAGPGRARRRAATR